MHGGGLGGALSPVLLAVGNDGEPVGVVAVAAHVRVAASHPRRRRDVLLGRRETRERGRQPSGVCPLRRPIGKGRRGLERPSTHGLRGGGAGFPAIGDVGLVGVVGVAQQRAGGRRGAPAPPRGSRFAQLDPAVVVLPVVDGGRLAALGVGRAGARVLADWREGKGARVAKKINKLLVLKSVNDICLFERASAGTKTNGEISTILTTRDGADFGED